jgi:ABC-type sugar transport system permease subunit
MNQFSLDTMSITMKNYTVAFRDLRFGYGMAISILITVITLLINFSYIKSMYKEDAA